MKQISKKPREIEEMTGEELKSEHDRTVARLRHGNQQIESARERGDDAFVARWEDPWIELLHRYEQTFDRLQALGGSDD